ncbi:MAG: circularly permuted type 2 ATP-grasp protein [Acidiphilium sp.]|nr:circularly permuted type 2 ATP-grasp protein [Acidiphilium sp.]MDD4935689.1 circularly permuted type 2 ATP-grasp protein [Acidiphilium sp.]
MHVTDDAIGGLIDAKGHIRAAWRPVVDAMQAIGAEEFAARAAALDRRARFESPSSTADTPHLDPIPVPMFDHEFADLAAAVIERVETLAALLDDLYGPQQCIADRSLPGASLFTNPQFVRQLARQSGLAGPRLGLYAIDLIRHPDGGFRVLRDHTDRASGLGLALAIRRFVAEVMPELFGAVTLASQRPVIETLQDVLHYHAGGGPIGLIAGADADAADARLLARQIGGMALRPDDLSCTSGALRLRTLAGSTPVHLLLRLGSSLGIDPLEQGGHPSLGVPGLFRALRNGAVTMLNVPGSAVLQHGDFKAHYHDLFWRRHGRAPRLLENVGVAPSGFNADQAPVAARTADAGSARFDFAAVTLRLFAVLINGVWRVLPGGLGYAARADGTRLVKDIWVIDSGEADAGAPGPAQRAVPHAACRVATDLPSRLADDLLWLGRMVERLDASARLLSIALPRFADASNLPHEAAQRAMLAACLVNARLLPKETAGPYLSARLLHTTLAKRKPLADLLAEICRLLEHCGERFSVSMRSIVEAALDQIPRDGDGDPRALAACVRFVATFNGVIAEDASRSGGFVFLEIGRRLERAEALAETLTILLDGTLARLDPGLSLAIELADAQLSYEFVNAAPLSPAPAIALLIGAPDYPRSLAFQTEALGVALFRIGATNEAASAVAITASLTALVASITANAVNPAGIGNVLQAASDSLQTLASALAVHYFAPVPPGRQVWNTE